MSISVSKSGSFIRVVGGLRDLLHLLLAGISFLEGYLLSFPKFS